LFLYSFSKIDATEKFWLLLFRNALQLVEHALFFASSRKWEEYNEALVKRGSILLDLDFAADWSRELKALTSERKAEDNAILNLSSASCSGTRLCSAVQAAGRLHQSLKPTRLGLKAPDYTAIC
jgi:hypothetical protein